MIVLDTNVLSELMRPTPSPEVKAWLRQTSEDLLVTTVITISEIEYGLARLPEGSRRRDLEQRFAELTGTQFDFSILPFEVLAARLAGRLHSQRENQGWATQPADMMIAAITLVAGAKLATRNAKDFSGVGLDVINPWNIPT